MRFRSRNHEIDVQRRRSSDAKRPIQTFADTSKAPLAAAPADKRTLIFTAVEQQLAHDNKRPWSLSQKLNDAPYRYTRDTLWAALNRISATLDAGSPRLNFPTEDEYSGEGGFSSFVYTSLSGTVSNLINAIMGASRWPK